jgi:hypothetical protein
MSEQHAVIEVVVITVPLAIVLPNCNRRSDLVPVPNCNRRSDLVPVPFNFMAHPQAYTYTSAYPYTSTYQSTNEIAFDVKTNRHHHAITSPTANWGPCNDRIGFTRGLCQTGHGHLSSLWDSRLF